MQPWPRAARYEGGGTWVGVVEPQWKVSNKRETEQRVPGEFAVPFSNFYSLLQRADRLCKLTDLSHPPVATPFPRCVVTAPEAADRDLFFLQLVS